MHGNSIISFFIISISLFNFQDGVAYSHVYNVIKLNMKNIIYSL